MRIRLVAYGIAKDIIEAQRTDFLVEGGDSVSDLKDSLTKGFPAFEKLSSLRFAVNEEYRNDDFKLNENDEVVIIPPVSGG